MKTLASVGHGDQTINKSRFVAIAQPCLDERDVALFLRAFAQQHPHASHLAFAYQLKVPSGGIVQRMNDAGEPSGTAGRPILQPIEGMQLVNVCVGVIRYYGGINLGTGGLARAYGSSARMALENAKHIDYVECTRISLQVSYSDFDLLIRDVGKVNGQILDKQFGELVQVMIQLPSSKKELILSKYRIS